MNTQFLLTLQQSHDGLRIIGASAAGVVLLSCLAISLMKPQRRWWFVLPSVTLALAAVVLFWSLAFFEGA